MNVSKYKGNGMVTNTGRVTGRNSEAATELFKWLVKQCSGDLEAVKEVIEQGTYKSPIMRTLLEGLVLKAINTTEENKLCPYSITMIH